MRYLRLFIIASLFFCSHASAKLFFTQHQDLYKKNTLKYLNKVNTNKNKLVDVAKELKNKFPNKKDQHLLNYYIKYQKPQTKLFINKDWIDIKTNGRQVAKITGINGDTNTLYINDKLIDFSEPLLVKSIELIKKSLAKRKRNVWMPMNLLIPRAEAVIPFAMLALSIYLSTQNLPGMAKANQPTKKPGEICENNKAHNFIIGKTSGVDGQPYDQKNYDIFNFMYQDATLVDTSSCRKEAGRYYEAHHVTYYIDKGDIPKLHRLCYQALEVKKICNKSEASGTTPEPNSTEAHPSPVNPINPSATTD